MDNLEESNIGKKLWKTTDMLRLSFNRLWDACTYFWLLYHQVPKTVSGTL